MMIENWTICICGNQPHQDGFYCCDADGTSRKDCFGPTPEWDHVHVACVRCRRIINSATNKPLPPRTKRARTDARDNAT